MASSEAVAELTPGAAVPEAVKRVQGEIEALVQARTELCGKVESLQERCAKLGATNEELKCVSVYFPSFFVWQEQ